MSMVITIDGDAGSGKGTLSKHLSKRYGLPHMDSGLLYRAAAKQLLIQGGDPERMQDAVKACRFAESLLGDPSLRDDDVTEIVSRVSRHPQVRVHLNERQLDFVHRAEGGILDGRAGATEIAPHADVKIFITATAEVRAKRRTAQIGKDADYESVLADILERDKRDKERSAAPMKPAPGATVIDTSNLSVDEMVAAAVEVIESRVAA